MSTHPWPVTTYNDSGRRTLVEDFEIEVPKLKLVARVPKDFCLFDGASVPRVLWTAMGHPFTKAWERAALVHDYLYKTPSARGQAPFSEQSTREDIDALFLEMLLQDSVARSRAKTMWRNVRRWGDKKNRFWTSSDCTEPSDEDEAALAHEIKAEALELIAAHPGAKFLSGSTPPADRDPELDAEVLEGLAEIDWHRIDPDQLGPL